MWTPKKSGSLSQVAFLIFIAIFFALFAGFDIGVQVGRKHFEMLGLVTSGLFALAAAVNGIQATVRCRRALYPKPTLPRPREKVLHLDD